MTIDVGLAIIIVFFILPPCYILIGMAWCLVDSLLSKSNLDLHEALMHILAWPWGIFLTVATYAADAMEALTKQLWREKDD